MQVVIDISEEDYNTIEKTVMSVEEMCETVKGRVYCAVTKGVLLPKGHGRLIDADYLKESKYQIDSMYCEYDEVVNVADIDSAPTLIEANIGEGIENEISVRNRI